MVEREARVLEALRGNGLDFVPELVGRWHDEEVFGAPFFATRRIPGVRYSDIQPTLDLDQMLRSMRNAGAVVAQWQESDVLPADLRANTDPLRGVVGKLTDAERVREGLDEALLALAGYVDGDRLGAWEPRLTELAEITHTMVHGDLCGGQFLLSGEFGIAGVVDWGAAHVGHPMRDFLFGEWSLAMYDRWESQFGVLREAMWSTYSRARRFPLEWHEVVHVLFSVGDTCHLAGRLASGQATDWDQMRWPTCLENLTSALGR
jgi:aminoglycoside phosphotransferase (APT) family kinase protein